MEYRITAMSRSNCAVTRGEVDLSRYAKLDGFWRDLGVSAPARRALIDAKILKTTDLKKISEVDFMELHGMGPKAAALIIKDMKRQKINFAKS